MSAQVLSISHAVASVVGLLIYEKLNFSQVRLSAPGFLENE